MNWLISFLETYSWWVGGVHLTIAVAIFFIVNWIGEHSPVTGYVPLSLLVREDTMPAFNLAFRVLAPLVLYVLSVLMFTKLPMIEILNAHSYMILVDYWLVRMAFILATGRGRLMNWWLYSVYAALSITLALGIYYVVKQVNTILPDPKDILGQLWIVIFIFLYDLCNKLTIDRSGTERRKKNYILHQFEMFRKKYAHIVNAAGCDMFDTAIVYSIMIYENFQRYYLARVLENGLTRIDHKKRSLGIMQFTTEQYINDDESVRLAVAKILSDKREFMNEKEDYSPSLSWIAYEIAERYNGGDSNYAAEIRQIYDILIEHLSKDMYNMTVQEYKKLLHY